MDAIEFIKQLRRMNKKGVARNYFVYPCAGKEADSPEEVVAEVREWAKMNPIKTRQSVFLEQYPEARIIEDGVLGICPANVSAEHQDQSKCLTRTCSACRRKFWGKEVE